MMVSIAGEATAATPESSPPGKYQDLLTLLGEARAFERPPLRDGAPDYTAGTCKRRQQELKTYQARLAAIEPTRGPSTSRWITSWSAPR